MTRARKYIERMSDTERVKYAGGLVSSCESGEPCLYADSLTLSLPLFGPRVTEKEICAWCGGPWASEPIEAPVTA